MRTTRFTGVPLGLPVPTAASLILGFRLDPKGEAYGGSRLLRAASQSKGTLAEMEGVKSGEREMG